MEIFIFYVHTPIFTMTVIKHHNHYPREKKREYFVSCILGVFWITLQGILRIQMIQSFEISYRQYSACNVFYGTYSSRSSTISLFTVVL